MLKKFGLENINRSKSVIGIEILLLPDASYEINLVVLKKEKTNIITEKQKEGIKDFDELATHIDPKLPLVVLLNGKGIIHKKVTFVENDTAATLLNKVLPNAKLTEFSIQQTPINSTQVFVSVIRTNVLNDIIEELSKRKLTAISGFFLGPFVITDLLPLMDNKMIVKDHFQVGNFLLQIQEQQITEITNTSEDKSGDSILIGDDRIPLKLVFPFAAALSYFILNNESQGIVDSIGIDNLKQEFKQKKKFEFRGWALLIATLLVLLVNYFVFDNYWSKSNKITAELAINQSAIERYDTLKKEFAQKKEFLEQNGLLENSRTSFYIDRLAATLPSAIQWTEVNVHPLKKKQTNEEEQELFFEKKSIMITGNCQRSTVLNDWMKEIKKANWISNVNLLNYSQDNANDDGEFLLEIKLK
ncbi:MAG: hypothetical protein A3F72_01820 [Bacteroidetes bacterium RIFCSPLOWO2_12_FULL_35_15]|nr:MAG: hypothetical protein A3F72_01820 [Bacteroidetes bacterium RIFCSPLOWO2_12_FULL_35_15]